MKCIKKVYQFIRSILFSTILIVAGLYVLIYVAISLPFVQNQIREIGERELSALLGTNVGIGKVSVSPGGEVIIYDANIPEPSGEDCIRIDELGAGIDITTLIFKQKIVFSYAVINGLHGHLKQAEKDSPWNIQFIIDALKPKDKNKPPTKFDLIFRTIVIRSSDIKVDKLWQPGVKGKMDFNHLDIRNLRADLTLPQIKNDDFIIDLRRLSLTEASGFSLDKLACKVHITPKSLDVERLVIKLPDTLIEPGDFALQYDGYNDIVPALKDKTYSLNLDRTVITPYDLRAFVPELKNYTSQIYLTLVAAGNRKEINVNTMALDAGNYGLKIAAEGRLRNPADIKTMSLNLKHLAVDASPDAVAEVLRMVRGMDDNVKKMLARADGFLIDIEGQLAYRRASLAGVIATGAGTLETDATVDFSKKNNILIAGEVSTSGFNVGKLLANNKIGNIALSATADLSLQGKDVNGTAEVNLVELQYNGRSFHNATANVAKSGKHLQGEVSIDDAFALLQVKGEADIAGAQTVINASADIQRFMPGETGLLPDFAGYALNGAVSADIRGISPDSMTGSIIASNIDLTTPKGPLHIGDISVTAAARENAPGRDISLRSDFVDGDISGDFSVNKLTCTVKSLLAAALPSMMPGNVPLNEYSDQDIDFKFTVKNDNTLAEYFSLPFRMLTDVTIDGMIDGGSGMAYLDVDVPYLQMGKDKLVSATRVNGVIDAGKMVAALSGSTKLPGKNDVPVDVSFELNGFQDELGAKIKWDLNRPKAYNGNIAMKLTVDRGADDSKPVFAVDVIPSHFQVADTVWDVQAGHVTYCDKSLQVRDIKVWHDKQHIMINGDASSDPDDKLIVDLRDIDLDYVFETLNINYVTFGGRATGKAVAGSIFDFKNMQAYTEGLKVKGLTYNGGLLGDADLSGRFLPGEMKVAIGAEIADKGRHCASIDGGVWVTRDSLSFDMKTDKVNVKFLQPFMQAFSSEINGRASGHVKLYGTFSDIDLTGRVFADTLNMKVDYTNVWYSGSDSVIMTPGKIIIPEFRIHDKFGNTAMVEGVVSHTYFHEPRFEFKVRDAHNLLCYNTDSKINPDWYGTIYGNGGGTISGYPGYVGIMIDMTVAPRSVFNFVLNDTEAADDYEFLTFTDKRREEAERLASEKKKKERDAGTPDFAALFKKKKEEKAAERPSVFALDIRATVTPQAEMILVMDPVGGDKIRAHGSGAMQLEYTSDSDEITMYGRYTLADGLYNFTLQDLILRDFTIKPGSNISFNGDPLKALLDISAIYRVNTNLTELDKSFASDRELNRTNVPVDAVLSVRGDMQSPEITFDIELPTLTQDVERKIKSIISTDDMMSRQIIYLLALNRFYTPEYMGVSSNGGEWASVASATVASQLSNMLSQLTDKVTVAPSFRTDKGDFSDMEVDVALSSRLLNNRLLLNGNFGYRDRATSNTTFVGDFDLEYLLNRSGNLRLKAYNHFNDQNYYLKSALTTQGIGIIFRKDFDNPFEFLRRKKKKNNVENDTIQK